MGDTRHLPPLDTQALQVPVGRALGDAAVAIADWQVTPVGDGWGGLAHLCRVSGHARRGGQLVPWSLILKIALPPASGRALPATVNWRREFLVYTSGLLTALPGAFTAPQCYGAEDRAV